jgi:hypothetical protein
MVIATGMPAVAGRAVEPKRIGDDEIWKKSANGTPDRP